MSVSPSPAALLLVILFGLGPLPYSAGAREYHVDSRFGSDDSPGTNERPLRSLASVGKLTLDAGTNLHYTLDFDDQPIPAGERPDMGAFEFQPGAK